MNKQLQDKNVLITGGTGSLGQTLVRRIMTGELGKPKKITIFSRDEAKQYHMKMSWKHLSTATDEIFYHNFEEVLEFRIGDVRDFASLKAAVQESDVVFHAAAMKQVPTCEYFPDQATDTNITGAKNLVRAVRETRRAKTIIGISTDKACKPINVMGMTKALQERILIAGNIDLTESNFICVRYGNVISSRGSVIPLFNEQIRNGGPVTITLPEMTRFLMSLNQAVDTIFAAIRDGRRGEIIVPRVPSAKVEDIATALIGDRDIQIKVVGIRPGEKIHEILVSEEESYRTTERGDYYVIQSNLPELSPIQVEERCLQKEFSSSDFTATGPALMKVLAAADFKDYAAGAPVEKKPAAV